MLLLGWATVAWPCAGLTHSEESLAESDSSVAAFEIGADRVTVTYEVTYQGDAADIGWVIPVPAEVLGVSDGDADLLRDLLTISAPTVSTPVVEPESESRGCGAGASKGGDGNFSNDDVEIEAQGFTGTYDYVVVSASEPEALSAWLDEHGWKGLPQEDLQHYVDLGAHFVGIRVVPDSAPTPPEGRELPPVSIAYQGSEMRFPSVMARHSDVPSQRTTVFVLAEQRATVQGWLHQDVVDLSADADQDSLAAFEQHVTLLGAERTFARIWANQYEGRFATRFDTAAPREVHDTDAIFSAADGTEPIRLTIHMPSSSGSAALLLLPLASLSLLRRRSHRDRV